MDNNIISCIKQLYTLYDLRMTPEKQHEFVDLVHHLFTTASNPEGITYKKFLDVMKKATAEKATPVKPSPEEDGIIRAFSDGACSGNPGAGGWGAVVLIGEKEIRLSGGDKNTTNNRMELAGSIAALSYIKKENLTDPVHLTTDSQYVKNGVNSWINNWKRNGWLTAAKEPVKNKDLWQLLDTLNNELKPTWFWVKGHKGHYYNELCDQLAVEQRDTFKRL